MHDKDIERAIDGTASDGAAGADQATTDADEAVAAVEQLINKGEALPDLLRARLIRDGQRMIAGSAPAGDSREEAVAPWWRRSIAVPLPLAAAASLVFAFALFVTTGPEAPGTEFGPAEVAQRLIDEGAQELDWNGLGDAAFESVSGEVIWSTAAQQGVLRVAGIPASEPESSQYQLWIVDPSRDDEPVDGGVFDVGENGALVEFRPRLPVSDPRAFAVTLEKAGGVVVSDGPLLFVASPPEE